MYERDVSMPTRDGTILRANVWRPAEGQAPTLVMRMCYDKDSSVGLGSGSTSVPSPLSFVNAGYAVVVQDVRGSYASDGDFVPKVNELTDSEDLLTWLAQQDWYDGVVGAYGASYLGMTQWALALAHNPDLKAIAPTVGCSDWYTGLWYSPGGALSLSMMTQWIAFMYGNVEQRAIERGEKEDDGSLLAFRTALLDLMALNESTPLASHPLLPAGRWMDDWLNHPSFDEYWKAQDWSSRVEEVTVPVLATTGWFDLKIHGQVADFVRVRNQGSSVEARNGSRLVIGPWDHHNWTGSYPDRYFGVLGAADLVPSHIEFFDEHLKGIAPIEPVAPVRIFVMGIDQWRDEADWPLPDTQYVEYHLSSGGSANTRRGDGALQATPSLTTASDTFRYDPRDPVPTAGGALLPSTPGLVGPVDQSAVDGRADVLCYTSAVLTEPVEVTGFVELKVFVSASTVDTDITAKLVDVAPDGLALNLCDGALRLRYRSDLSDPMLMIPGEIYEVTVSMSVTSNVFLPGHRIRLDISASNFPRYDRNSNTGGAISFESLDDMIPSDVSIHHGGIRPSRLILPIVER
ncbi:CocE/NonD family hydrolase [Nocardia sp. NPDC127606]|uniref:CocE/NonD family hydrolase n=1 Tax=Nocardia sp. NPDC127606 TaxID=3345406 RepID=UPI00364041E6